MARKILILHGWEANSNSLWFPKVKNHFEEKGFEVFVPDLPGGYFPKKEDWLKIIESFKPDESWTLIGHSLGSVAILRFLEKAQKPIDTAIITACPKDEMEFEALANFFPDEFEWEKIRQNAKKISLIYEEGDEVVPLGHGEFIAEKTRRQTLNPARRNAFI